MESQVCMRHASLMGLHRMGVYSASAACTDYMHGNEMHEATANRNSCADKDMGKAVDHQSYLAAFAAHHVCSACISLH